ncbi:MAG: hypothetical protein JWP15_459 [Alphaproteobacteria bacterium]|nr:hypothetical protein [Alphaproteobacteria bacterium]
MSLVTTYFRMLFEPQRAFGEAMSKKVWTLLLPFFLAVLFTAILNIYYFYHVDIAWLRDQMTASMPSDQRDVIARSMTRGRFIGISIIGVCFLALTINLGRAFIYWLALKVQGVGSQGFVKLFAVVVWSTAPLLLILPAGLLNISLAPGGHLAGNDVNPVSLNQLLFHLPAGSAWGQLLSTFSLVNLWEIALIGVGIQYVSRLGMSKAMLIALLPDAIVYGIWGLLLAVSGA